MDSVVHPDYRSQGIGGQLIEARYNLCRQLNLRGMLAGSLIADYYKVARQVRVEHYVQDVIRGQRFDSNLSKQLRKGFRVHSLTRDYTIDATSLGWGVTIVWDNPDYRPARQPAASPVHHHTRRMAPVPLLPIQGRA